MSTRTRPRGTAPAGGRAAGFTLIEMMVTVTILGVLTMLVIPGFSSILLGNRLASYSNDFVASAQMARSEAMKRGAIVTMCRSSDGATCAASGTWQQGWIVRAADGTVLHVQEALSSAYRFTGTTYTLSFPPSGVADAQLTLRLCRADPDSGNQERTIVLTPAGRTYVKKETPATTCS